MTDVRVVDVGDASLPAVKAFLSQYPETSLFLLSNIRAFGTRLGESMYSGNLKAIREDDTIRAVFCVTRGGSVLAQTGGSVEFVDLIVKGCIDERIPIRGVLGEWTVTSAIWQRFVAGGLRPTYESKEIAYRRNLASPEAPVLRSERTPGKSTPIVVRNLTDADHAEWLELSADFTREIGLPLQGSDAQRRAAFVRSAGLHHWWGAFVGDRLVSMAAITAMHAGYAQVGGVYTRPEHRRCGLNRAIMARLVRDARDDQQLDVLFLFTSEANLAARRLYESMGFERFGYFGLFYGE